MNQHIQHVDTDEDTALPEHLAWLPGGSWALWRWVGLRGSGFPAAEVRKLADPASAAAADRIIQAEAMAQRALNQALELVNQALDALRRDQQWDDPARRDPLVKALRQLKQGRLPDGLGGAHTWTIEALRVARAHVDAAWADFRPEFDAATARTSEAIYDLAGVERFQEAVIWQNRHAFHTGLAPLLRNPPGAGVRGSKRRQYEELVANYLQRYCVKNDTIGFFGPVGWARVGAETAPIVARPGPGLLATRTVYFEAWCIDALARTLSENKALRPWLAPRRLPFLRLDGTTLHLPLERPSRLPANLAAVLHACDGTRSARDIAAELARDPDARFKSSGEVYSILAALSARGLITWTLEVPLESHPEKTLRRLLDRVGDESLRRSTLGALAELEAARDGVARAAGDAARLNQALEELETTFTRLTGAASTRSAGKMYAGRTLVYEDCRRDVEVALGADLLQALGPSLSLLLTSARWFMSQAAAHYRTLFKQLYDELAREAGAPTVDLVNFWMRVQPLLFDEHARPADILAPLLRERWSTVLAAAPDQRRAAYTSEELRARVLAAFDAPDSGWRSVCYHSPDIMIAAASQAAINAGDYQFVMGELHLGMNTLGSAFFMAQHPAPEDLFQSLIFDLPEPRLMPVISRSWFNLTGRTRPTLVSTRDFRLVVAQDTTGGPQSRALPVAQLVVEQAGDGLIVRTRDGRMRFDLSETFAPLLALLVANSFQIISPERHTPRVTFDRLVVARETWRFAPADLPFMSEASDAERFVAVRRWARDNGMPRCVFVKAPVEVKPCYVDFDSPIYVAILAKIVRRTLEYSSSAAQITITEMLPGLEQVWLPDAEGRHYTSEFRFVALHLDTEDELDHDDRIAGRD